VVCGVEDEVVGVDEVVEVPFAPVLNISVRFIVKCEDFSDFMALALFCNTCSADCELLLLDEDEFDEGVLLHALTSSKISAIPISKKNGFPRAMILEAPFC
jgi:hypothetical protein